MAKEGLSESVPPRSRLECTSDRLRRNRNPLRSKPRSGTAKSIQRASVRPPPAASRSRLRRQKKISGIEFKKQPAKANRSPSRSSVNRFEFALVRHRQRRAPSAKISHLPYGFESSAAVGTRPSGVYLSTASGRCFESLERISSRDKPVSLDRFSNTSDPIAFSS